MHNLQSLKRTLQVVTRRVESFGSSLCMPSRAIRLSTVYLLRKPRNQIASHFCPALPTLRDIWFQIRIVAPGSVSQSGNITAPIETLEQWRTASDDAPL